MKISSCHFLLLCLFTASLSIVYGQTKRTEKSSPSPNIADQNSNENQLLVTPAMIKYVEDYLGMKFETSDNGVEITSISDINKVKYFGNGNPVGKIFKRIGTDNNISTLNKEGIVLRTKEDFVSSLLHFKNEKKDKTWVGGGQVWYRLDISGLNIQELIDLSKSSEPLMAQSKLPSSSDSLTRGSGDPLKGLNVTKAKEITSGTYYALIIGVNKYSGVWPILNTAVHDAKGMENTLHQKYKMDHFYTLYDEQATRSAIMKVFEKLVDTLKEDDNVLIYFSGHGEFKQTMNKGYWVPYDAKTNSVSDLISNNDIQTFLASIKSKHTLLISDACFSGDIFRGTTISIPFEESDKYYLKVYNKNSRQAMTSGGIEPVMDGGKDGHSVFAYYLLKTLSENSKTYFDAGQLYDNLKIPVVNNSDQTPILNPVKNTGDEGGQFIFIKK
jgi:hypothetical protein